MVGLDARDARVRANFTGEPTQFMYDLNAVDEDEDEDGNSVLDSKNVVSGQGDLISFE